jgi:hypothetical protein
MRLVVSKPIRVYKRYALFGRGRIVIRESYPNFFPVLSTLLFSPDAPPQSMLCSSFLIMSINEASLPCVGSTNPAVLYRRISYCCDLRICRLHWALKLKSIKCLPTLLDGSLTQHDYMKGIEIFAFFAFYQVFQLR